MKTLKNIFSLIIISCVTLSFAQQTPAPVQKETISITGATVHVGNGTIIEHSILIIEDGKIQTCVDGRFAKIPLKGKIINANGHHIYPGFIAANTSLGLVEVNAVRASNDQDELGEMIPHIRSLIAYNAESKVVESMRPNGILIAQVSPNGGLISGTSSIMQLDAWNWEDAALKVDDGIHLNWPRIFTSALKPNTNYAKQINKIEKFISESKAYLKGDKSIKNLPYQAMDGLYNGLQKLYVHVNNEKGIIDAVHFANDNDIANLVIVGGYKAYKITDLLKKNNVAVLLDQTHGLPKLDDHDYDLPYKNPKILAEAGILVGIHTGNKSNFQTRNLPFYAGQVVGQGMDKEEALKLITSNTAKILGIDKHLGTIEEGKDATLFISEGDALDMRTNNLTHAFINGRNISLETHQTKLWKRYSKKYNGE